MSTVNSMILRLNDKRTYRCCNQNYRENQSGSVCAGSFGGGFDFHSLKERNRYFLCVLVCLWLPESISGHKIPEKM